MENVWMFLVNHTYRLYTEIFVSENLSMFWRFVLVAIRIKAGFRNNDINQGTK